MVTTRDNFYGGVEPERENTIIVPVIVEKTEQLAQEQKTNEPVKKEYLEIDESKLKQPVKNENMNTDNKQAVSSQSVYTRSDDVIWGIAFLTTIVVIYWIYKSYKNKEK